ncbi:MAG: bifunctional UDP-sugar hydrolase/5'-nucleotidase [Chloroflexi bacterium]|nr:bifunctional UDP-sugar hydrolase/5'-nucleotidase [Chloroflexota bacterium]
MRTKQFTILHSNDMHGDLIAEKSKINGELVGGLSLLSGYLNSVRRKEKNVLYLISGDMLQGSLIDSEFKGISTIEVMNYLAPDVVTLGNHELDYGLPHLLFLEKMANFPIVNANLYIKKFKRRLMQSHIILSIDGFSVLFIGVITEAVLQSIKMDSMIGTLINLEEAASEVSRICDAYKNDDIDLTILMTHIGFESDKELAAMIDPELGVDMIIGGHSHTYLEQPVCVNNILIAQAGTGTDQIGRFDITVDGDTNSIVEWKWKLVPITSATITPDEGLQEFINGYYDQVNDKYNSLLCKLTHKLTHLKREIETPLGNFLADILRNNSLCDVVLLGSGSIRSQELGPVVTLGTLLSAFPYDDRFYRVEITGAQLKHIFSHIMSPKNRNSEGECFQVNAGVQAVFDDSKEELISLKINGADVEDQKTYTLGLQAYHLSNCGQNLNISAEEIQQISGQKLIASSLRNVIEEQLRDHQNLSAKEEGRLVYI